MFFKSNLTSDSFSFPFSLVPVSSLVFSLVLGLKGGNGYPDSGGGHLGLKSNTAATYTESTPHLGMPRNTKSGRKSFLEGATLLGNKNQHPANRASPESSRELFKALCAQYKDAEECVPIINRPPPCRQSGGSCTGLNVHTKPR